MSAACVCDQSSASMASRREARGTRSTARRAARGRAPGSEETAAAAAASSHAATEGSRHSSPSSSFSSPRRERPRRPCRVRLVVVDDSSEAFPREFFIDHRGRPLSSLERAHGRAARGVRQRRRRRADRRPRRRRGGRGGGTPRVSRASGDGEASARGRSRRCRRRCDRRIWAGPSVSPRRRQLRHARLRALSALEECAVEPNARGARERPRAHRRARPRPEAHRRLREDRRRLDRRLVLRRTRRRPARQPVAHVPDTRRAQGRALRRAAPSAERVADLRVGRSRRPEPRRPRQRQSDHHVFGDARRRRRTRRGRAPGTGPSGDRSRVPTPRWTRC